MAQLSRIRQMAIEQEASEGTLEVLVAADVQFECEELKGKYTNEFLERNPLRASLSQVPHIPGIGIGMITGKAELVGGGGAAVVPPTVDLFLSSGHAQYVVNSIALTGAPTGTFRPGEKFTDGGSKVGVFLKMTATATLLYAHISGSAFAAADTLTGAVSGATGTVHGTPALTAMGFAYRPIDPDSTPAFTAQGNHDGKRFIAYGARTIGSIVCEGAGKLAYFNFDLMGKAVKAADLALFASGVTLPTVLPEAFLSAALTLDGESVCVDGFTIDLGLTRARRVCANDATGIRSFRLTDRKPTLTLAPEADLESVKDFFTEYDAGTQFAATFQVGSTTSKRMLFCAPACQWQDLDSGDREGIETYEAPIRLNGSVDGDDEYIIAFY